MSNTNNISIQRICWSFRIMMLKFWILSWSLSVLSAAAVLLRTSKYGNTDMHWLIFNLEPLYSYSNYTKSITCAFYNIFAMIWRFAFFLWKILMGYLRSCQSQTFSIQIWFYDDASCWNSSVILYLSSWWQANWFIVCVQSSLKTDQNSFFIAISQANM